MTHAHNDVVNDSEVEAAAEELYGAALSAFTSERKRLTDRLKASGSKASAAVVGKLPKPSMSAWVVNQLWRREREDMDSLLAAGSRVREGDGRGLDEQRRALAGLRAKAATVLEGDGHAASPATIQRVATTLQALSALGTWEPDAPGRLIADRDPPGFDVMMGAAIEALATKPAQPQPQAKAKAEAGAPPRDELAERRERERANRARVRAAERALLERSVEGMKRAVVQRSAELANAEAEVKVAESALERARGKVGETTRALAEAEARVADAEAALAEHDRGGDE